MRASARLITAGLLLICGAAACGRSEHPAAIAPEPPAPPEAAIPYPDSLARLAGLSDGAWPWAWRLESFRGDTLQGGAELALGAGHATWRFWRAGPAAGPPPEPVALDSLPSGRLLLLPAQPLLWHEQLVLLPRARSDALLPLPRIAAESAYYADLLDLLQRLTAPRFRRVTHWPGATVPVRADSARSGEIDLAACLAEAVALWNESAGRPDFTLAARADWGVALVHRTGLATPPLATRVAQMDSAGRPLRLEIVVGDNYAFASQRAAVVRGMAHELAHTLLLWGHSEDRRHLLWRCGPLSARPSADELRAIALWNLLPQGCDLSAYGRSVELDPQRQQSQGPAVHQ